MKKYISTTFNGFINEDKTYDKETIDLMSGLGDEADIKYWIEQYHSKPSNYKKNTYFRVERRSFDRGYAGVGNGLYLGRDKKALSNFYDLEQENLPISEYYGKPKWLDLTNKNKFKTFKNTLSSNGIDMLNSDDVSDVVISLGYDGIKYYDPLATGEEYVLFNTKAVRKV